MAARRAPAQAGTATAPARRRRGELSRREIAEAALAIIDAEGADALTMRRLADAVGVGTMTIYGHFRNKDELLDAAVDAAASGVDLSTSGPWRERLEQLVTTVWEAIEAHSALVSVRLQRPVVRPEALRFGEEGMAILREAGLDAPDAAKAFRLLFTFVFGYAALSPSGRVAEARRQTDVAIAGLADEDFPQLRGARDDFVAAVAGREAFAFGLTCVLDGIEARVAMRRPPGRGGRR